MKKFMEEFKQFIARGNVMDMAVGVIIGGAFSAVTTSLIDDIIMPVLGLFTGSQTTLRGLIIPIPGGDFLNLGNFISVILNFLIMAFVVFCLVKALNKLQRKKEAPTAPPAPPEPSAEEKLLAEIRDLLKEKP